MDDITIISKVEVSPGVFAVRYKSNFPIMRQEGDLLREVIPIYLRFEDTERKCVPCPVGTMFPPLSKLERDARKEDPRLCLAPRMTTGLGWIETGRIFERAGKDDPESISGSVTVYSSEDFTPYKIKPAGEPQPEKMVLVHRGLADNCGFCGEPLGEKMSPCPRAE